MPTTSIDPRSSLRGPAHGPARQRAAAPRRCSRRDAGSGRTRPRRRWTRCCPCHSWTTCSLPPIVSLIESVLLTRGICIFPLARAPEWTEPPAELPQPPPSARLGRRCGRPAHAHGDHLGCPPQCSLAYDIRTLRHATPPPGRRLPSDWRMTFDPSASLPTSPPPPPASPPPTPGLPPGPRRTHRTTWTAWAVTERRLGDNPESMHDPAPCTPRESGSRAGW